MRNQKTESENRMRRGAKPADSLITTIVADDAPTIFFLHQSVHLVMPAINQDALFGLS